MSWHSDADHTDDDYDNHANQMNPNNDEYWHSREIVTMPRITHRFLGISRQCIGKRPIFADCKCEL